MVDAGASRCPAPPTWSARLADAGLLVALASSGETEFSEHAPRPLGIGDLVDVLTTSDDADESKPEPDILGATLERSTCDRAVLVGDTPYDVEAAAPDRAVVPRRAHRRVRPRASWRSAGAAVVVDDPSELPDVDWEAHLRSPHGV